MVEDKFHLTDDELLETTGFYGVAGSGCIFLSRRTGRVLLGLRGGGVEEPNTWGCFGGATSHFEDYSCAARREAMEETGVSVAEEDMIPLFVFKSGSFVYHNFLVVVKDEFIPKLNWETSRAEWFHIGDLPDNLHYGMEALFSDRRSVEIMLKSGMNV